MEPKRRAKLEIGDKAVALYHLVYEHESFEAAAQALLKLVQEAETLCPGKKRKLFLDIEGHRNSQGGFDAEMAELQEKFLLGFLGRYLSEFHCPVASITNPKAQNDDIPPALIVRERNGKDKG